MNTWIEWAFKALLIAALAGNIFWIKKWIKRVEEWQQEHDTKATETNEKLTREGGLITRNLFFDFCKGVREKCSITTLSNWRETILACGGVMTRDDCEEVKEKQENKLFIGLQKLIEDQNKRVDVTLQGVREAIHGVANQVGIVIKNYQAVVERIDRHIDKG